MVSISIKKYSLVSNLIFAVLAIILLVVSRLNVFADWPEFRGPQGNGHASAAGSTNLVGFPLNWSEMENLKWKTAIPEVGWSTPVVMGGQVWLTSATTNGHDFFVICVDAETGQIRFNEKLFHCDDPEPLGNKVNCYATPSCVIEPGRVYVHFGSYGTACLDASTAKVIWKRQDLPCRHYRGPASSLILFENLLILTMDGVDVQYLAALDKKTGETVWKTNRSVAWNDEHIQGQMAKDGDLRKAHCTPLIVDVKGKLQMLTIGAKAAYGYEPRTGKEIWRVQYNSWSAAPMPLYDQGLGLAFIITGLANTELLAVRPDGNGDVTDTHVAWKYSKAVAKTASPILLDGLIYMVSDDGMGSCIEAATGNLVWQERFGGRYAASPILADGRLYFFNQSGKTPVLKPGRTYEVLATNNLENGFMASPAVSGKSFFLRTKTHLYRIESSKP